MTCSTLSGDTMQLFRKPNISSRTASTCLRFGCRQISAGRTAIRPTASLGISEKSSPVLATSPTASGADVSCATATWSHAGPRSPATTKPQATKRPTATARAPVGNDLVNGLECRNISILLRKVLRVGRNVRAGHITKRSSCPQRDFGQRPQIRFSSSDQSGGGGVSSQFLLQTQSARQPVHQRMVEVQDHAKLAHQTGQKIVVVDVGDFMGKDNTTLLLGPVGSVARQQDHRTPPSECGGREKAFRLADFDPTSATHLRPQ